MKKLICTVISALIILIMPISAVPASADTRGAENGYYYTVSNGEATITGIYDQLVSGNVVIPDKLGGYPVTSIPDCSGWSNLTSITIPDSVTNIGEHAFAGWESLKSVTIGKGVKRIGRDAFYHCSNLTSLTIPFVGADLDGTSNTHFGYIFGSPSCNDNQKFVPESLKTVVITGGGKIDSKAFLNCKNIKEISVTGSVKNIKESAFFGCSGLTSFSMTGDVENIGEAAFYNCTSLKKILFSDALKNIGNYTFYHCGSLERVTLPSGITRINDSAFEECTGLKSITIPDGVTSIGRYAFEGCGSLTQVIIPNSVKSIEERAFQSCTRLSTINIPENVESIDRNCFLSCNNLLVCCKSNSYAQRYCINIGINYQLCDDVTDVETVHEHKYDNACDSTCNVCGEKRAVSHAYKITITKEPTCTEKGMQTHKCSKCGAIETKEIAALGHSFSNPTVIKQPTCTENGIRGGKCTRCGRKATSEIKATGHTFGSWTDEKSATCTKGGTQKRTCSKCHAEETKSVGALGHDFENPTVVKKATISSTGLIEGKCKRCGETTSEVTPCTVRDDQTGIIFQTNIGVFAAGTQITVEEIKKDNPSYESVKNILSEVTDMFTAYDISAVLNGAEVQPGGEVTATFRISADYGTDVAVFHIADDGSYEKLESTVSGDGKTVSAKLTHFSHYAVCRLSTGNPADIDITPNPTESSHTVWYIIVIAAVTLIAGAVTALIIRKKNHKNP